jgi:CO/xanthine dehydrogenase Mo-binding subunit
MRPKLINVEYEVLPAVARADDALLEGVVRLWDRAESNLFFYIESGKAHCS